MGKNEVTGNFLIFVTISSHVRLVPTL